MRSSLRRGLDNIYERLEATVRVVERRRFAKKTVRGLAKPRFDFEKQYRDRVLPFWQKYGVKPKKYWYLLYSQGQSELDPRYIPDDLYFGKILPYFSNMSFRRYAEDKCYHEILFGHLLRPRTIAKNVAGVNYDGEGRIVTRDELVAICAKEKSFIIKPSVDSGTGRLIAFYDADRHSFAQCQEMINRFDCNFIVQEVVEQHEDLACINQTSLNTVRILSFLFEGEVHVLSGILRMGTRESRTDNISAGGIQCAINPDGSLHSVAADKHRNWLDHHPNGIKFADIRIPSFERIKQIVQNEHRKLAHFKLIGWDFAINKDAHPVFIEYNVCPGANQMTCGPTFGELTERVLEDVFIGKTYRNANN